MQNELNDIEETETENIEVEHASVSSKKELERIGFWSRNLKEVYYGIQRIQFRRINWQIW